MTLNDYQGAERNSDGIVYSPKKYRETEGIKEEEFRGHSKCSWIIYQKGQRSRNFFKSLELCVEQTNCFKFRLFV